MTNTISVGGVKIGGGAPVAVQSMTKTMTSDARATAAQINSLAKQGCDIARVAVPDMAAADAIGEIKGLIGIPLVADIHFDYRLALRSAEAGADKIRINPGNIGGTDKVREVARMCARKGIPIRIGVNGGSLGRDLLAKHGGVTAEAMYESAVEHVRLLNRFDFDDICLSAKASSATLTVAAYRLLHERTKYPLHLGVTEAGTEAMGIVKSSIGIGALLLDGIGDTIRVSLTAPPEREVEAALAILGSLGLRGGFELISCPTCARCGIDLIAMAHEVERRLGAMSRGTEQGCGAHSRGARVSVAVMGCAVNGPGEASRADYGIAGGDGEGIIFKKGTIVEKLPMEKLVDGLFNAIESGEKRT